MSVLHAPLSTLGKASRLMSAIRFQESLFALPFAYTGMFLAAQGFPGWREFTWITVAMIGARTFGMSANRIVDRHIDARNPRNSGRHLPAGLLSAADMTALAVLSLGIFVFAAYRLNTLALVLAPVAAAYLLLYPFTKRFTWTANLLLGVALAIAPAGAWIGVAGALPGEALLLSLAVALWAGSFDIIYHVQDVKFYTDSGLHSVASRFGAKTAVRWAGVLDFLAVSCLVALGIWMQLGLAYTAGLGGAVAALIVKYVVISSSDIPRMGAAFFRINAIVSSCIFAGVLAALLVEG